MPILGTAKSGSDRRAPIMDEWREMYSDQVVRDNLLSQPVVWRLEIEDGPREGKRVEVK